MLNWYAIESTAYYAADASSLSSENLYFLTDTHEIYRGTVPFTDSVVLYTGSKPASPARKKIYIDTTTLKGEVYTGTEWVTVIKPIADTVTAEGTDPVSGKAVADYVASKISEVTGSDTLVSNVTYDKGTVKLTVTKADGTSTPLVLEGLATQLAYDKNTGKLDIKDVNGTVLGTGINLDLERFVKGGSYDENTKTITLWFDDADSADASTDKIDIPVGDLVDTYTAESTATVQLTVTGNKFTANVIASKAEGNLVELKDDGIYVAASTLDAYQKLVADASTTKIPMLNAAGQIINGTMTAGGAAISESPNATTLATELAVNALITSTKATIDTELAKKMALVNGAAENNVATFGTNGQVKDSGKSIGGATLASAPNENTLATEAAVKTAVDAANTELSAKIKTNADAITILNGDSNVEGSVDKKIADATNDVLREADIATSLSASSTDAQVASAKVVYDQLTWKTML